MDFDANGSERNFFHLPYSFTTTERENGKVLFVFQIESYNINNVIPYDRSITLYDPFRELWLLLDYCDMFVKIKYSNDAEYQNLYPLTYRYASIEDGKDGGTLSAPFNVEGEPIVLIGANTPGNEVNHVLMKLSDGKWGEFLMSPAPYTCCGFSSEGGRKAGASHYARLTSSSVGDLEPNFSFNQISISNQVLHLQDPSRGVDLHVDLKTRSVEYSDINNPDKVILWTISNTYNESELYKGKIY